MANWNKDLSQSKSKSMSIPNNAILSLKLFATTLIKSIWSQYAFHIQGKSVVTTLKKTAKMYLSNIVTKFHSRSKRWYAAKNMAVMKVTGMAGIPTRLMAIVNIKSMY